MDTESSYSREQFLLLRLIELVQNINISIVEAPCSNETYIITEHSIWVMHFNNAVRIHCIVLEYSITEYLFRERLHETKHSEIQSVQNPTPLHTLSFQRPTLIPFFKAFSIFCIWKEKCQICERRTETKACTAYLCVTRPRNRTATNSNST